MPKSLAQAVQWQQLYAMYKSGLSIYANCHFIQENSTNSMLYSPPFHLTHSMTHLIADISEMVTRWKGVHQGGLLPHLRRENRIRTIQATLAVEQNTLSVEQVTAVMAGKHVIGTPREILEVQNAFAAYDLLDSLTPTSTQDVLGVHRTLMAGLVADAGRWRRGGAGIYRGKQLVHMAPPASQVPRLMAQLLDWLSTTNTHPLIASSAFHYEFEFIHPFSDGNGRMGRLWQTLILSCWHAVFAYLPVETVIKKRQSEYYEALGNADRQSDCSEFIEFLLNSIHLALTEAVEVENTTRVEMRVETRVEIPKNTPQRILQLVAEQPHLSMREMAERLGKSLSTIERAVATLKQQQKLTFIGAKKSGRWQLL